MCHADVVRCPGRRYSAMMNSFLYDIFVNVFSSIIVIPSIFFLFFFTIRALRSRRIWTIRPTIRQLYSSSQNILSIVISTSAIVETGYGSRPMTGIGQVRALAALAPSLHAAYRRTIDHSHVFMSKDCDLTHSDHHGDLITLGGPKTNEVALALLNLIELPPGYGVETRSDATHSENRRSDVIVWNGVDQLQSNNLDRKLVHGLIIRCQNPLGKDGTLTMFIGSGTYGTEASALAIVQSRELRSSVMNSLKLSLLFLWDFVKSNFQSASTATPQERRQMRNGYIALVEAHESTDPSGLSKIGQLNVVEKRNVLWNLSNQN